MKTVLVSSLLLASLLGPQPLAAQGRDCSNTSEGLTPISDLGAETYLGQQGGLYPGGSNEPPEAHELAGLDLSLSVIPRDLQGNPDTLSGRIVLIAVGMSSTDQEFARFMGDAHLLPDLNPSLVLFNGAGGRQTIEQMTQIDAPYWGSLVQALSDSGLSAYQVQAVWLKQAYAVPPSPEFSQNIRLMSDDLTLIVDNIKWYFPNAVLCYCTSRVYGGYTTNPLRNEPGTYESAFGFKLMIEDQIDGSPSLNYNPNQGPVLAPWLSWGTYMWADGLNPRSDGLIWECEEFEEDDGYHLTDPGLDEISSALIGFFSTDPTSAGWFRTNSEGPPVPLTRQPLRFPGDIGPFESVP